MVLEMTVFLCVLSGLLKLSFFQFNVSDEYVPQAIVNHRKQIALQIMNFVCEFLFFVLSCLFSAYIIFQFFSIFLGINMELHVEDLRINENSIFSVYENAISSFNFHNNLNFFVVFWQSLVICTTLIILLSSYNYLKNHNKALMEFPLIVTLAVYFLCVLISANDLYVVFMATIGFSLSTYVLVLSNPDDKNCCEAGIKYFYLSALSSGLIAFGLWIAYFIFSSLNFFVMEDTLKEWHIAFDNSAGLINSFVCFLMFGFFFKLAAFPCHLWAAAVYEGSPQPIMAFFVLPIKIAVLTFFFKFFCVVLKDIYNFSAYLLWFSAVFSMLVGAFAALIEKRIKKFFAYSSINQMGFLLIGGAIGSANALLSSLNYLLVYITMNCGLFVILLNTFDIETRKQMVYLTDFTHFAKNNLKAALSLILILFSMAGIPPLAGFFGKFYLLIEAMTQHFYFLIAIGLFTTMLSTYYYLKIIKHLLFDNFFLSIAQFRTKFTIITYLILIITTIVLLTNILFVNFVLNTSLCVLFIAATINPSAVVTQEKPKNGVTSIWVYDKNNFW